MIINYENDFVRTPPYLAKDYSDRLGYFIEKKKILLVAGGSSLIYIYDL
jgi:hypothetical protein